MGPLSIEEAIITIVTSFVLLDCPPRSADLATHSPVKRPSVLPAKGNERQDRRRDPKRQNEERDDE
jgi:hypothetical protein